MPQESFCKYIWDKEKGQPNFFLFYLSQHKRPFLYFSLSQTEEPPLCLQQWESNSFPAWFKVFMLDFTTFLPEPKITGSLPLGLLFSQGLIMFIIFLIQVFFKCEVQFGKE